MLLWSDNVKKFLFMFHHRDIWASENPKLAIDNPLHSNKSFSVTNKFPKYPHP
jgi:hypothetical protein